MPTQSEILGWIAHTLNDHVAPLDGYADILHQEIQLKSESRADAALQGIERNIERLHKLVAELQWIAGSTSVSNQVENTRFSIADLIVEVRSGLPEEHSRRLEVAEITSQQVRADRSIQTRILQILIGNALAHSEDVVTIGVQSRPEFVAITVSDSGPTMRASEVPDGFRQFVVSSPNGRGNQTALGLVGCKLITNLQGGDLIATGDERGARFEYTIPSA